MCREELIEEYQILRAMLANINTAISALLGKPKKYTYSNVEATHIAEQHSLDELRAMRKDTKEEMQSILNQCQGSFIKLKNY